MSDEANATRSGDLSEAEARRLVAGDYGRASLEHVAAFAVPFFIVRGGRFSTTDPSQNAELLANGTTYFVDLGSGPFGVTANHVVNEALAPEVVRRGLIPVQYSPPARPLLEIDDLRDRVISQSIDRDVATFRISRDELDCLGVSIMTAAPVIPIEGQGGVAFVGFPGAQRRVVGFGRRGTSPEVTLSFAVFPGFGVAASVSDRQVTFQFDRDALIQTPGFAAPPPDFDLGGMSGGPMLSKLETLAGIEHWAPAGIITEGRMLPKDRTGLLFATRADCLRSDGGIDEQA